MGLESMTQTDAGIDEKLKKALEQGVVARLPLTFLPFVNQQLKQWDYLFPNERRSVERLLLYVAEIPQPDSEKLFRDVVELENKMGVRGWRFSTREQTILNSSQLASSPYFEEWRRAVRAVFDVADGYAIQQEQTMAAPVHRLILIDLPRVLPVDAEHVWRAWQGIGRPLQLDLESRSNFPSAFESLIMGSRSRSDRFTGGLLDVARARAGASPSDTWTIDAGASVVDYLLDQQPPAAPASSTVVLSYARLDLYRKSFSHEMNTMRKDLADADAVFDRLRQVDVGPWCPPEVSGRPVVREFLRSLFLSGNGAVIFGNSFVEWAASEAFRRARPSFLAARFGVRSKPKPFTGVAIFENPEQVNPLPAVDDLEGSVADAQILAFYIWLAASRFEEYRNSTVCVCIAENIAQARLVAPPEFYISQEAKPVQIDRLGQALRDWMA